MTFSRVQFLGVLSRNVSWVFGATVLSGAINLCALAWFARTLGPSAMGEYAQIVITIDVIAAIVGFGFNQVLIRNPNNAELRAAVVVATVVQTVIFIALSVLAFSVLSIEHRDGGHSPITIALLLVLARIVGWFTYVVDADFRARLHYRPIAVAQIIAITTGTTIGVWVLHTFGGTVSIAIRDACISLILFSLFIFRYRHEWSLQATRSAMVSVWRYSRSLWALNVLERLTLRLDYLLVGYVLGRDTLGVYFSVRGIVEGALGFLIRPIQTVLYSFYCRIGNAQAMFKRVVRLGPAVAAIGIAAAVSAYVWSPATVVKVVLGPEFAHGAQIIPGLVLYGVSVIWFENTKAAAMSASLHARVIVGRLFQLAALALLTIPMTYQWGLLGAGLATGVGAITLATVATVTFIGKHVPKSAQ